MNKVCKCTQKVTQSDCARNKIAGLLSYFWICLRLPRGSVERGHKSCLRCLEPDETNMRVSFWDIQKFLGHPKIFGTSKTNLSLKGCKVVTFQIGGQK